MPIDWTPLVEFLAQRQRLVITSHVRPDADAIGTEVGLAELLRTQGKTVRIVNVSATPRRLMFLDPQSEILQWGVQIPPDQALDADGVIIVDTSSWSQLAEFGLKLKASPTPRVVIDHHLSQDDLSQGEGTPVFHEFKDVHAEAAGTLVVRLAQALGWPMTTRAATALFAAIATDTGWFRFPSTTPETYWTASQLMQAGAVPSTVFREIYEQGSLARAHLAGRILQRIALDFGGRLGHTYVRWSDYEETGAEPADTEDLVNECLKIAGTECAFIAAEQRSGAVRISFRSRTAVDVSLIANQFGGGGHRQAAAATLDGPFAAAQSRALAALRAVLEGPA